jgi:hypothetical protein
MPRLVQEQFRRGIATARPGRFAGMTMLPKRLAAVEARVEGGAALEPSDLALWDWLLHRAMQEARADESAGAGPFRCPVSEAAAFLDGGLVKYDGSRVDGTHERDAGLRTVMSSLQRLSAAWVVYDAAGRDASMRPEEMLDAEDIPEGEEVTATGAVPYLHARIDGRGADAQVVWSYPETVAGHLLNPTLYSWVELEILPRFRSVYSHALYGILSLVASRDRLLYGQRARVWRVSVEEFCKRIGYRAAKLNANDLRRVVLEPAREDLLLSRRFNTEIIEIEEASRGRTGKRLAALEFRVGVCLHDGVIAEAVARAPAWQATDKASAREFALTLGADAEPFRMGFKGFCRAAGLLRREGISVDVPTMLRVWYVLIWDALEGPASAVDYGGDTFRRGDDFLDLFKTLPPEAVFASVMLEQAYGYNNPCPFPLIYDSPLGRSSVTRAAYAAADKRHRQWLREQRNKTENQSMQPKLPQRFRPIRPPPVRPAATAAPAPGARPEPQRPAPKPKAEPPPVGNQVAKWAEIRHELTESEQSLLALEQARNAVPFDVWVDALMLHDKRRYAEAMAKLAAAKES